MRERAEVKENLMSKAEEEIEKLLDWMEEKEVPDLSAIEEVVLELRKRIGEGMAEEVIANQESVRPVPSPNCPKCEEEMHYKGIKEKEITSMIGETKLYRGYYYCDRCQGGLFPPRQTTKRSGEELVRECDTRSSVAEWRIR
jgi:hypothetical protein